ncbi:prolyl 4-hydroxylase subunit alpha-2-like [Bactrocera neohumeralis]|uniref:prolyl 4-hydroxylase subunit alpha-2-like n=1 Tax=Bactrocera neohumeralis TaxID=98809 RepID=UPI002166203C|nr:prolyl 4-hydroxylase subunit alpha-2-like [Bactrocera neohumeralis]
MLLSCIFKANEAIAEDWSPTMKPQQFIVLALLTVFSCNVSGDYYTSVISLFDLLELEMKAITYLEAYMEKMEAISRQVNETLNELEQVSQEAEDDFYEHYSNPLNAYKIIRRFVIDWQNLNKTVLAEQPALEYIANITALEKKDGFKLPTDEDLLGASKGLARLQRTYQQETIDVAAGDLMEMNLSSNFTASECFWLGRNLYSAGELKYAAEWLIQARIRLAEEIQESYEPQEFIGQISDVQILEQLSITMFYLGKSKLALLFNEELLAQDPNNVHGLRNRSIYSNKALEERYAISNEDESKKYLRRTELDVLFDKTCNGELQQTPREKRRLRCRYVHNNVPFRFIAPFKKEELNLDPSIAYYHESIFEKEIERILNATEDYVERSMVGDLENSTYSDVRTSQNTWLDFKVHPFLNNIAQRLRDATGLSLESGEHLQVANYGIGGHYGAHYDFSEMLETDEYGGQGNRIATALFYINDVELGGATAFPYLRLTAPPVRGSMIVWYNLHKSLELDYRTKHGGCPVLVGSKWICNEWFHATGQEFLRPCGKKKDGHKSIQWKDLYRNEELSIA